ncbi:HXXXD-type acyl-transferase family protein [Striga asiatica]|uniref:HXXXD-type acyl-transferase family protein n=1 Tax=Striga asiatica TaxID=4170 RepID=A0A5A7R5W0_STRAF|nr:HXXXD-type acyl-transferase family protein [Striga asiatica]
MVTSATKKVSSTPSEQAVLKAWIKSSNFPFLGTVTVNGDGLLLPSAFITVNVIVRIDDDGRVRPSVPVSNEFPRSLEELLRAELELLLIPKRKWGGFNNSKMHNHMEQYDSRKAALSAQKNPKPVSDEGGVNRQFPIKKRMYTAIMPEHNNER